MKIATIIGARPQFIKASAFSRKLRELTDWQEILIHTGQHFDEKMSAVFFDEMAIPEPDYNLNIHNLPHGAMTGRMLEEIEKILIKEKPDLVLVYGDTNSTLAGALAAKKLHLKLAHIEAGMRSFNMKVPEEINRVLTDRISDYLFCPSQESVQNLNDENIEKTVAKVYEVGDIMLDSVLHFSKQAEKPDFEDYILLTFHRQENTDDEQRLTALVDAINEISKEKKIVCPLHPRTREKLKEFNLKLNVEIIEPVGYLDMLGLIKFSNIILTDSGGLQKEALYLNKFCITLREETEWTELLEMNVNAICSFPFESSSRKVRGYENSKFPNVNNPYGDGKTAEKIILILEQVLK